MIINYKFIVLIALVCAILQASIYLGVDWFQFSRPDVDLGQWWRLLSANFIHLNWTHYFLNIFALIVIQALFTDLNCSDLFNFSTLIICGLGVTVGIWNFLPELLMYVGLSGALHGLLVVYIILELAERPNWLTAFLAFLLSIKLIWEYLNGPLPGSEMTVRGNVIVESHLYGATTGLLFGGIVTIFRKTSEI